MIFKLKNHEVQLRIRKNLNLSFTLESKKTYFFLLFGKENHISCGVHGLDEMSDYNQIVIIIYATTEEAVQG